MIKDAFVKKLSVHKDVRGRLFEILRSDDIFFENFGQAYVTICNPGWVKGWHYHKKQTDIFCVLRGKVKVVLYDLRKNSKTKNKLAVYLLQEKNPSILRIPKGVVHGFECIGKIPTWILNLPDKTFNRKAPDEFRISLDSTVIPYKPWKNRKGW